MHVARVIDQGSRLSAVRLAQTHACCDLLKFNALATELRAQWLAFDRELRQGKLKHLDYDSQTKTLT